MLTHAYACLRVLAHEFALLRMFTNDYACLRMLTHYFTQTMDAAFGTVVERLEWVRRGLLSLLRPHPLRAALGLARGSIRFANALEGHPLAG